MFNTEKIENNDKNSFYESLTKQLVSVLEDETNPIANLSNASALLFSQIENLNWLGFYIMNKQNTQLVLASFQGKVACVRIPVGRGVCGSAVKEARTFLVENVHDFPGHIACDSDSNSEIVVPLFKDGQVIAVLDIDSPILNRFDQTDKIHLEKIAKIIENSCDISLLQFDL